MPTAIRRNPSFAESNITVIGITTAAYGRPQYFLVNADAGASEQLKFPGIRFRAPNALQTFEDAAQERFEEQTGLTIDKMLGLRAIVPTRSRHDHQWLFRNVFLGLVTDLRQKKPDGSRQVYLADPGQGTTRCEEYVFPLGHASRQVPLVWVRPDNHTIARIATDIVSHFNWETNATEWYRQIPCVNADQTANWYSLGSGMAIASMMLLYRPSEYDQQHIILLHRKGDRFPGYAGGKIESLESTASANIDPISCCIEEGAQEYGFPIQPRALICVATTPLQTPLEDPKDERDQYYSCLVNYAFVAEPRNPHQVDDALQHPQKYLEEKMEAYAVESLDQHRDRLLAGNMRMPDMMPIGEQFYRTSPGSKIPLTQIVSAGTR